MAVLDKSLPKVAKSLLRTFGRTLVFTEYTTGAYVPATDSSPQTTTSHSAKAVITDYRQNERPGVMTGDKKVIVAASDLSTVPTTAWRFTIATRVYEVVDVTTVYSGELPALYELQGRGA